MLTAEKDLFKLPQKEIQTYRMGCHDGSEDKVFLSNLMTCDNRKTHMVKEENRLQQSVI